MTRDYKGIGKKKATAAVTLGGVLSFLSGLSLGLLIAYGVYLYGKRPAPGGGQLQDLAPADAGPVELPGPAVDRQSVPAPKFDFYRILPSREVNISEWIADEGADAAAPSGSPAPAASESDAMHLIQVGSFETFEAADQTKAQLALIGISADIQRVVINGQDVRHRVRIGPFSDRLKFEEARQRLTEHGMNFMVLKLGGGGVAKPET